MSLKEKYISTVLIITTIEWALWVGGQFFNALMVVPGWSADMPRSIRLYEQNMLSHINAYFFLVVNPAFPLPFLIAAWILSLSFPGGFKKWLTASVVSDVAITLAVGLWMAPTARSIFAGAKSGGMGVKDMLSKFHTWQIANNVRIALGILTLFFFLMTILKIAIIKNELTTKHSHSGKILKTEANESC